MKKRRFRPALTEDFSCPDRPIGDQGLLPVLLVLLPVLLVPVLLVELPVLLARPFHYRSGAYCRC